MPSRYFFKSQSTYSKMRLSLFSAETTYFMLTMLGWFSFLRRDISLTAVEGYSGNLAALPEFRKFLAGFERNTP